MKFITVQIDLLLLSIVINYYLFHDKTLNRFKWNSEINHTMK